MTQLNNKILVVYDLPEDVVEHDQLSYLLFHDDRPTERDIVRSLKKLGYELFVHGIYSDVSSLWNKIQHVRPQLIVNLCETFRGNRQYEGDVASLLELTQIPYTGSPPAALHLCKDKGATKKIVAWSGIHVPQFQVVRRDQFNFNSFKSTFPLLVKPLNREASEGISNASLVYDWTTCEERSKWVAQKLKSDVIIEEYIHGRELYIGVLEKDGVAIALPVRELHMEQKSKEEPMIATYRAKWDETYRNKWGISTKRATNLQKNIEEILAAQSVQLFNTLGLKGYARIDWRLSETNEPIFIEANPNPALSQDDDFAKAAKAAGWSYSQLIEEILSGAMHSAKKSTKFKIIRDCA